MLDKVKVADLAVSALFQPHLGLEISYPLRQQELGVLCISLLNWRRYDDWRRFGARDDGGGLVQVFWSKESEGIVLDETLHVWLLCSAHDAVSVLVPAPEDTHGFSHFIIVKTSVLLLLLLFVFLVGLGDSPVTAFTWKRSGGLRFVGRHLCFFLGREK